MRSHSPARCARPQLEPLEARDTPAAPGDISATGALGRFTAPAPPGYTDVRVATGDVTGDGMEDVIATSGPGGLPLVTAYDGRTGAMVSTFFAFDPQITLGLNVASADVDADGRAEVIVGTATGASFVAVLDGLTGQVKGAFFALPGFAGGVTVAAGDVSADGRADVIVGTASLIPAVVVFSGANGGPLSAFLAFGSAPVGVNVGFANGEILTGTATGPPFVATYAPTGQLRLLFLASPSATVSGVRVAGAGALILTDVSPFLITFDQLTGTQVRARSFSLLLTPVSVG